MDFQNIVAVVNLLPGEDFPWATEGEEKEKTKKGRKDRWEERQGTWEALCNSHST